MAISNYTELKAAIQNWSKRTDSLSVRDDMIALCESDMWQKLRIRDMEARATADSPPDRYLALPTGFVQMRKLRLVGAESYPLIQETPESMRVVTGSGRPKAFAVTSQLEFDRKPDTTYTVEMQYYRELTGLSASNATNAVITRFPQMYLYGCLFHLSQWAQDDEMLAKYAQLFDGEIKRANLADRRGRHGPVPSMRTEASTP